MPEPEAHSPAEIQQTVAEARYAATSATGSASIQIINYHYSGPVPPAPPPPPGVEPPSEANRPCPYRGLFHFGPNDAAVFFGREAAVETLQQALQRRAVLPLLGASGSGKSSVVFAGLVPRLERQGHWRYSVFRPGTDPFHALALALVPLYAPSLDATEAMLQARRLAEALRTGALPLADVLARVRQSAPQDQLLLIADQFEELYSLCPEEGTRRAFLDALLAGFAAAGGPGSAGSSAGRSAPRLAARLLLTMRADFLGSALADRPFADLFQQEGDGKAVVMLGPMHGAELREAIERPAAAQLVAFEAGLVERILEDVAAEPGQLPLLEFALTELWSRRQGSMLTHAAYTAIGGVEGALARHADASFAALAPAEQQEARRVLLQLVRPGEGTEDTRRLATRQELGEARWPLARRLADDRLVVTSRNAAGEDTLEVVHEALIRHWGELRSWLAADRGFRAWQERLRGSLAQWQATDREEGGLLRGAALAEARDKLQERPEDLAAAEREFIEASVAAEDEGRRRVRQRRRLVFGGLSGGLAVVSVALLLAWGQLVQAQRQRGEALAASAKLTVADGSVDALVMALAAAGLSRYGKLQPNASLLPATATEALMDGKSRYRELYRLRGHRGRVWSASFSGDGSRIMSAGEDEAVRLWDAKSRKGIGEPLRGHKGTVFSAAFSGDGIRIVSAGWDGSVRLWHAKSGKAIGEPLRGHQGAVLSAAFSGDGSRIVSAGNDETLRVWEAKSGKAIGQPLRGHQGWVRSAAFSGDGSQIVSTGEDGTVRVWDAKSGKAIGQPLRGHHGRVLSVAFSGDRSRIVSAGTDGTVRLWNAKSGKAIGEPLRGHLGRVRSAAFSGDGSRIVSAGEDGTVRLWIVKSGMGIGEPLRGHQGAVLSATFSGDGSQIVSAGEDGTVRVWDAKSGKGIGEPLRGHQGWVRSADFNGDGSRIVSAGWDGTVRLWNAKRGMEIGNPLRGHQGVVRSAEFSRDGSRIVSAGWDGTMRLWNAKSGKAIGQPLRGHQGAVLSAGFSGDGSRIVSAGEDGTVQVWDAKSDKAIGEPLRGHYGRVWSAAFSGDGSRIVSAGEDETIQVWNAKGGKAIGKPLRGHQGAVRSAAFSGDGTRIVSAGADGTVRVWEVKSGKAIGKPLRGHRGWVMSAAFNGNGRRIVSAGDDGTVRVWDAKSGKAIGEPLRGHQGTVLSAAFSRDGSRIVSAGGDGTVRLWDPAWTDPIRLVCRSLRTHESLTAPTNDVEREARRTCERWGWR